MEAYRKSYYKKLATSVEKKLVSRNFDVVICDNVSEAKEHALNTIGLNDTVGFGGSVTVEAVGIIDALHKRNNVVYDRNIVEGEEKDVMMRKSLTADYFLTSFNGISKNGEVVNIDGRGNRVAAITFGPKKVLAFVGMNKIYGDLDSTISSVRNHAAPLNVEKIGNKETPCNYTGSCDDCFSADSICNTIAIQRRSGINGRITVYLIIDELGF